MVLQIQGRKKLLNIYRKIYFVVSKQLRLVIVKNDARLFNSTNNYHHHHCNVARQVQEKEGNVNRNERNNKRSEENNIQEKKDK